jgi:hypothetical protein
VAPARQWATGWARAPLSGPARAAAYAHAHDECEGVAQGLDVEQRIHETRDRGGIAVAIAREASSFPPRPSGPAPRSQAV